MATKANPTPRAKAIPVFTIAFLLISPFGVILAVI